MNKKDMMDKMALWVVAHDQLSRKWDRVNAGWGLSMVGTPLWEASWGVFESYTRTLGELIGDRYKWLDWFCYDNAMGGRGHPAGYDDNMKPIETLADLADLIIEGRERS